MDRRRDLGHGTSDARVERLDACEETCIQLGRGALRLLLLLGHRIGRTQARAEDWGARRLDIEGGGEGVVVALLLHGWLELFWFGLGRQVLWWIGGGNGFAQRMEWDEGGMCWLEASLPSPALARGQAILSSFLARALLQGRAGRVRAGKCFSPLLGLSLSPVLSLRPSFSRVPTPRDAYWLPSTHHFHKLEQTFFPESDRLPPFRLTISPTNLMRRAEPRR